MRAPRRMRATMALSSTKQQRRSFIVSETRLA
jgi:hypothetical protein